ncbi:hypothetical protein CCACVL1_02402, partial [Corchorus capsularis]
MATEIPRVYSMGIIRNTVRFQTQHKRCNPPFHLKDHRNTKANLDPAQRCIQERGARQQLLHNFHRE